MKWLLVVLAVGCGHARGTARLWIGGDVELGAGRDDALAPLVPLLRGRAGIVNLEGPVAAGGLRVYNAPAGLGALRAAGVRVVGVENNHAGDAGPRGRAETRRAAAAAGLAAAGAQVVASGGWRVVVTAHDLSRGVPAALAGELAAARRGGDVLVATFHVTGPPSYLPRAELERAVAIALAAGARVVAAHGSHALARVERRGAAVIAWGLGNLAFDCDCTDDEDGLVLLVDLGPGELAAAVLPVDAGLGRAPARPACDPDLTFDLLESLGSTRLRRQGRVAWF